jgi:hypothetical protein
MEEEWEIRQLPGRLNLGQHHPPRHHHRPLRRSPPREIPIARQSAMPCPLQEPLETADRVTLRCFLHASLNSIEYFLFDVFLSFVVKFDVVDVVFAVAAGHRRVKGERIELA